MKAGYLYHVNLPKPTMYSTRLLSMLHKAGRTRHLQLRLRRQPLVLQRMDFMRFSERMFVVEEVDMKGEDVVVVGDVVVVAVATDAAEAGVVVKPLLFKSMITQSDEIRKKHGCCIANEEQRLKKRNYEY